VRLKEARIKPLADEMIGDEIRHQLGEQFKDQPVLNVFKTLGKSLKAYRRFMAWGGYILSSNNDLNPRDRELIILRTGYNWQSGYEWAQHARIGRACGLSEEEISRIKIGPEAPQWSDRDRALLNATDDLTSNAFISEGVGPPCQIFPKTADGYRLDGGQYTHVSMSSIAWNTLERVILGS